MLRVGVGFARVSAKNRQFVMTHIYIYLHIYMIITRSIKHIYTRTRPLVFDDPDCAYVLDGSCVSIAACLSSVNSCRTESIYYMTTSLQCTHYASDLKSWQFVCKPITSSFVRPLASSRPIIISRCLDDDAYGRPVSWFSKQILPLLLLA